MLETILDLDRRAFEIVNQQWHTELLDSIMIFLTTISDMGFFWWAAAIVLIIFHKRAGGFYKGITLALSIGVVFIIENSLNWVFQRPRPPLTEDGVRQLVDLALTSSFPSGHAASSFAAMTVLVCFFSSAKYWALPLAVIFSYSRLYVGMHFPLDSIAGAVLGIITGYAVYRLMEKYRTNMLSAPDKVE
ncbi:phosphatase PAP2 family protein [Alkalicoccus daliensis]|uniref:Undecaprenyl-diphosphatase n=1 Tax=Alkalicoccus daliensis TaxID=745820 RepID=A0A1H0GZ78_9BACI|nr:phosphatase PAP2 family protein [Alkalicoccus daliensis]SDO12170.1 undecaprenyl-diphosphatase [Alkalicoccus daliensis]